MPGVTIVIFISLFKAPPKACLAASSVQSAVLAIKLYFNFVPCLSNSLAILLAVCSSIPADANLVLFLSDKVPFLHLIESSNILEPIVTDAALFINSVHLDIKLIYIKLKFAALPIIPSILCVIPNISLISENNIAL